MNAATLNIVELPLTSITLDEDLQPRAKIDQQTKEDYVYAIADGVVLPPVTVVFDGTKHWLADGYHRFYAHETLGFETIAAAVRDGNALDAVRISLAANASHGKRCEPGDYSKAYGIACRFELVAPTDIDGVAALLHCSVSWAERLTKKARDLARAEQDEVMQRGSWSVLTPGSTSCIGGFSVTELTEAVRQVKAELDPDGGGYDMGEAAGAASSLTTTELRCRAVHGEPHPLTSSRVPAVPQPL